MPENRRTILQSIFGDNIAEMLGGIIAMIGMLIVMIGFMSFPYILIWLSGSGKSERVAILEQIPPDTKTAIEELENVQLKIQGLLSKIQKEVEESESLLEEKKKALSEIQSKIEILKLTPEQLNIVENYNKSVDTDYTLAEWIKRKTTWFQIFAGFIISFLFYRLGVRRGERHKIEKIEN